MGADSEEQCPTKWKMTPLLRVLFSSKTAIARLLIKKGADIFPCDDDLMTVYFAVAGKDPKLLTEILERGASKLINKGSITGNTPIHMQESIKSLMLTKILIEHGASPNIQDDFGRTPYNLALHHGSREVVVYLQSQLSPEEQAWKRPPPAKGPPIDEQFVVRGAVRRAVGVAAGAAAGRLLGGTVGGTMEGAAGVECD
ncbi:ankyrin repeat-containing domain protein [Kalaharituber pfeilii]|nr:ankyrin repeat-containing domain protein [Kalaharituber pfeilii]